MAPAGIEKNVHKTCFFVALKHLVGLWEIDLLPLYDSKKLVRADLTMNGGQNITQEKQVR